MTPGNKELPHTFVTYLVLDQLASLSLLDHDMLSYIIPIHLFTLTLYREHAVSFESEGTGYLALIQTAFRFLGGTY